MPRKKVEKEKPLIPTDKQIMQLVDKQYQLHPGQLTLDHQVFVEKKKRIFAQCGRNWGKSIWIARTNAKFACLFPKSHCYIICPEKAQAQEIYWASDMLKGMIPEEYIAKNQQNRDDAQKTELRIRLTNGSFIKLLGADEPDRLRGIKPHLCSYDEYRDFKADVYWSMEANLAGKNATLLIGSTPPDVTGHYSDLRTHFINEINSGNQNYHYLELPTETNPHISKDTLADIKRRLFAHGQSRVWEREYMAKFIPGGASSVFPMFAERREDILKPGHLLDELIRNDRQALEFYALFDPASSSVFGVLLAAINKYTAQVFILDEIYERDRYRTSSVDMWLAANEKKKRYNSKLPIWENTYDEHESWFSRDLEKSQILELEGSNLDATSKQSRDKQEDLAIIKDLMLSKNKFFIAEDRCTNLINEIESYATDKDGKIQKKKDHLIDCMRYLMAASGYSLNELPNYEEYLARTKGTRAQIENFEVFLENKRKQDDWTIGLDESSALSDDLVLVEDLDYGNFF